MAGQTLNNREDERINIDFNIDGVESSLLNDVTIKEIILGESLLTPGLQTAITFNSFLYNIPAKNWDQLKNKTVSIKLDRPSLQNYGITTNLDVSQTLYRMDNRKFIGNNVSNNEEFTLHACDQSLLNDAKSLVSKSWKCTPPSDIVRYVLGSCVGVQKMDIESSSPARDYIAENIHPFQVISQQAQVALAAGNDPSFVHFMTYRNLGTHHFKSLKSMASQQPVMEFNYSESGDATGYGNPFAALGFSFPCDFDVLSDVLNGINESGQDKNTLTTVNPRDKSFSQLGNQGSGCGLGGFNYKTSATNKNSAKEQNSCPSEVETYMLKRQARMGLLERDKVALRISVPWNPIIHAGDVIQLKWKSKEDGQTDVYGAGTYLVASLMHKILNGGFSVLVLDCVASTVGRGEV